MRILRFGVIIVFCLALLVFSSALVRDYMKRDTTYPKITSDREVLEISCDYTQNQLLAGIKASDEKDGDLTDQIIAVNMSRFIEKGLCDMTYVVFDEDNLSASLTRRIRFTDYYSPQILASQPLVFKENGGNGYKMLNVLSVKDALDGDLTQQLVLKSSTVNYALAGEYYGTFEVSNSFGDSRSLQLPIHIVDNSQTIDIQLSTGITYCKVGENVDPRSFIKQVVNREGEILSHEDVIMESMINTAKEGVYEIHYKITSGNQTGETWLTVVVES